MIVPSLTFAATAAPVLQCGGTPVFADIVGPARPRARPRRRRAPHRPAHQGRLRRALRGLPGRRRPAARAVRRARARADRGRRARAERRPRRAQARVAGAAPPRSRSSRTRSSPAARAACWPPTTTRSRRSRAACARHGMSSGSWSRHTGETDSYDVIGLGFNYRLDEPRSALLLSRLPRLEAEIERRRELTRAYRDAARRPRRTSLVPYDGRRRRALLVLRDADPRRGRRPPRRGACAAARRARRPDVGLLSRRCTSSRPTASRFGEQHLPHTERVARTEITLPLFAHLDEPAQDRVVDALGEALAA